MKNKKCIIIMRATILIWLISVILIIYAAVIYDGLLQAHSFDSTGSWLQLVVGIPLVSLLVAPLATFYVPIILYYFIRHSFNDKYHLFKTLLLGLVLIAGLVYLNPWIYFGGFINFSGRILLLLIPYSVFVVGYILTIRKLKNTIL